MTNMNRYTLLLLGFSLLSAVPGFGQMPTATPQVGPATGPYSVVERGANYQVWQSTRVIQPPSGAPVTNQGRYIELQTGMNYFDGRWLPSQEIIMPQATGGSAALQGQHRVYFPANIYTGPVSMVTPSGEELESSPAGLGYYDGANFAIISAITNSVGEILESSNQVLFPNAFMNFQGDLLYTYHKTSFESDVVFHQRPPPPEQFGINPSNAWLQVWTEFYVTNGPAVSFDPGADTNSCDPYLDFGGMKTVHGRAFILAGADSNENGTGLAVRKRWVKQGDRNFLIEEVPYPMVASSLQSLPSARSLRMPGQEPKQSRRMAWTLPRRSRLSQTNVMQMAKSIPSQKPEFVLDYLMVNPGNFTNYVFHGDATYLISGAVNLFGSSNIFEGGAVIKFSNNATIWIQPNALVQWQTSPYHPLIFTSEADNSVGQSLVSGFPVTLTNVYLFNLNWNAGMQIRNVRFEYAGIGIQSFTWLALWDCQFVDCSQAIRPMAYFDYYGTQTNGYLIPYWGVALFNDLFARCETAVALDDGATLNYTNAYPQQGVDLYLTAQNVTAAQVGNFVNLEPPTYTGGVGSGSGGYGYGGYQYVYGADGYSDDSGGGGRANYPTCISANSQALLTNCLFTATNQDIEAYLYSAIGYGSGTRGYNDSIIYPYATPYFGCGFGGGNVIQLGGVPGVYSPVAAGYYYLSPSSGYKNIGSLAVQSNLLSELQQKTTDAPNSSYSSNTWSSANYVLQPYVQRNTNTLPIGYCYDPIDYLISDLYLTNTAVLVTNGTVIAFGNDVGITVEDGSTLVSQGSPQNRNYFVHYSTVQEETANWGSGTLLSEQAIAAYHPDANSPPVLELRLSTIVAENGGNYVAEFTGTDNPGSLSLQDCEIFGAGCNFSLSTTTGETVALDNNLFQYCGTTIRGTGKIVTWNNLFTAAPGEAYTARFINNGTAVWTNLDNAFDNVAVTLTGVCSNSAYLNTTTVTSAKQPTDITTNIAWVSGPFGSYYQATNSPLINRGSRTANLAGLYHYTAEINQIPDGTNVVTIGYHYVATDTNGVPLDSNGDGIPDYLEDPLGNGLPYDGMNWALAINRQPADQTVIVGSNATLSVIASGVGTLSYQWYFNSNLVSGATSAELEFSDIQTNNAGYYFVIVTNDFGAITSSIASLIVIAPPATVAIGGERIMELTGSGDVVSWGGNQYGEFGDDTYMDSDAPILQGNVPVHVVGLTNIVAIASGMNHSLALDSQGLVWTWGQDDSDQLGDGGSYESTNLPEQVIGVTNVIAIGASGYFDSDGFFGFSLAAETNGTVWTWGKDDGNFYNSTPAQITDVSNAVGVAAADEYAVILEKGGSVWTWGGGDSSPVSGLSNIVAVCAGDYNYAALDSNGIVWTNGPNAVTGISNVAAVAVGYDHYLALDKSGQLWAWGDDSEGQLGDGGAIGSTNSPMKVEGMTNIISIAAGSDASVAADGNNDVWQFGISVDYSNWVEETWSWGNTNGLPALAPQYEDFYDGQLPDLTILNGNNQTAHASQEFPEPLVFQVTNTNGLALSNAPVSVQVIAGDMALRTVSGGTNYQGLRLTSDVNGRITLIGYADRYASNTNCLVMISAASRQQLEELDFTQTIVTLPTVSITSPANGGSYLVRSNQTLSVAVDAQAGIGGSIAAVDYYYGTNGCANMPLGDSTQCPFSFIWTNSLWWNNAFFGTDTISAVAVDNAGVRSDPQSVTFTVALDSAGSGIPDYWQIEYFGTNGLDPNSSPDGNGQPLLYDYQNGINPTDYYSGNVPTLTILAGNDQSGVCNAFLPLPLAICVTDSSGNILTNAPITLDVTNGTALLATTTNDTPEASLSLRTDSNGLACAWVYFPPAGPTPPDSAILVSACSTTNCAEVIANEFVPMAHWTFNDTNTWVGAGGQLPLIVTNVVGVPDWSSNAVQIDSVNPSVISYNVVETNGSTNINCQVGSVLFWFRPDWTSANAGGSGPGAWGRLIEMGDYSSALTNGWWSLFLNANGDQLLFATATNDSCMTNLTANISWQTNVWYQIALTYAPTGSAVYVDGQLLAMGSGVSYLPNANDLVGGFRIGSDQTGSNQAAGAFDELQTFSYPLSANNTATFDSALPAWWEVEYFNATQLNPLAAYGDNHDLLYYYTRNIEPNNAIGFTIANTSRYFNSPSIAMPVLVTNDTPYFEAVLLNDTNVVNGDFSNAVWEAYTSSNITVNLGAGEGPYSVWIGLRGWPADSAQTWVGTEVWLRTNAPVITITNPGGTTVAQPIIQVQGLVSETLSSLTYDISNAAGFVTNQTAESTPWFFDTNVLDFTTNFFQCYDVPLTNGVNTIIVHAVDLAGNSSTTNVTVTLDYSTATPPNLSVVWPTNGMCISGTNFTFQGQLDDDTATVTAQIVDTNGDTNTLQGLVERSGLVWVQNLSLMPGTNTLTVTATNAAGLSTTVNLTVMQSRVVITMNPLNQFNQANVSVTGTISDPTCSLTVNGTNAYYLDTNGDWKADNVPVSPTGTALFNVQVFTGDPTPLGAQTFNQTQPPAVVMETYTENSSFNSTVQAYGDVASAYSQNSCNWGYRSGGTRSGSAVFPDAYQFLGNTGENYLGHTNPFSVSTLPAGAGSFNANWEDASYFYASDVYEGPHNTQPFVATSSSYTAKARIMIADSGQAQVGQKVLHFAQEYVSGEHGSPTPPINSIRVRGQNLVPDSPGSSLGDVVFTAPAGSNPDITPSGAPGSVNFGATASIPQLISQCVATTPVNQARTNIGVGEQVNLFFNPALPPGLTNIIWSATAGSLSTNNGPSTEFTAPDRATNATVSATVEGLPASIAFKVLEPTNVYYLVFTNMHTYDEADIGFVAWTFLQPDSVNFYAVQAQEEQAYAVATGVYSEYNGSGHQALQPTTFGAVVIPGLGTGAIGNPAPTDLDNMGAANDECYAGSTDPTNSIPFTNGSETLVVPWDFRVGSGGSWKTNFVTLTWHCSESDGGNDDEGLLNASKSNASVQMNVNDPSVGLAYVIYYIIVYHH